MTDPLQQAVEVLARALCREDLIIPDLAHRTLEHQADYKASASLILAEIAPMIEAAEREACAKVADQYHADAVKWAQEQVWFTGEPRETDSSRIAAAIRERGKA